MGGAGRHGPLLRARAGRGRAPRGVGLRRRGALARRGGGRRGPCTRSDYVEEDAAVLLGEATGEGIEEPLDCRGPRRRGPIPREYGAALARDASRLRRLACGTRTRGPHRPSFRTRRGEIGERVPRGQPGHLPCVERPRGSRVSALAMPSTTLRSRGSEREAAPFRLPPSRRSPRCPLADLTGRPSPSGPPSRWPRGKPRFAGYPCATIAVLQGRRPSTSSRLPEAHGEDRGAPHCV